MEQYPKWLYHAESDPKLVNDPDEHEALGAGWEESPVAAVVASQAKKKGKHDSATSH